MYGFTFYFEKRNVKFGTFIVSRMHHRSDGIISFIQLKAYISLSTSSQLHPLGSDNYNSSPCFCLTFVDSALLWFD